MRSPRTFEALAMFVLVALIALAGCGSDGPALTGNEGTTATLQLPESDPPFLTKAVADRIQTGMAQEDVLSILRDAAEKLPAAKTALVAPSDQSKLNTIRYDLTLAQGKRRLVLNFKSAKLVKKEAEGMD